MARMHWVEGADHERPDVAEPVLLASADGPPGERAVVRLGEVGHEGDDVLYVLGTDAWVERTFDGTTLRVSIHAWDQVLAGLGVDVEVLPASTTPSALPLSRSLSSSKSASTRKPEVS